MKKHFVISIISTSIIILSGCTPTPSGTILPTSTPTSLAPPAIVTYAPFISKNNEFSLKVPASWQHREENTQIHFTAPTPPTDGTIITSTLLTTQADSTYLELTTEAEFFKWKNLDPKASPDPNQRFYKLDTITIDGNDGVLLVDTNTNTPNEWIVIAWWRKDGTNQYLVTTGQQEMELTDLDIIMTAVESFEYTK